MIEPWKIIVELESDNSRLFKEAVIENHLNNLVLQEGLVMCLDPLVTFGVKQVPESEKDGKGLSWADFKKAANLLVDREKTGHAARDLIIDLIDSLYIFSPSIFVTKFSTSSIVVRLRFTLKIF